MKGSELLLRCLENEEVRWIFGVPGEETLDVLNSLVDSQIRFIPARHEQGAAFYGRCPWAADRERPGSVSPPWGLVQPICSPAWQTRIWIAPRWLPSRDKLRWIECTKSRISSSMSCPCSNRSRSGTPRSFILGPWPRRCAKRSRSRRPKNPARPIWSCPRMSRRKR
jgi:Thiamine pyrophosphate-requiring enzymes [acetolactate synthase, pyruvate dehydrogenase (cytochrome), glyoxylate carboligase, phosphonopyruvate decarboxylase]